MSTASQAIDFDTFTSPGWQMRPGERSALEGVLCATERGTAIELGTYRGGSLRRIAAHHDVVHTFDLTQQINADEFPNAVIHIGDSHELLPTVLEDLHRGETSVSFALVDGDHSPDGAQRDLLDLLDSPAVAHAAIVLHDTGNLAVRRGISAIDFARYSKVAAVMLDFVPAPPTESRLDEAWAGLGLIMIDADRTGPGAVPALETHGRADIAEMYVEMRRNVRRMVGNGLRRCGLHPAQRNRL